MTPKQAHLAALENREQSFAAVVEQAELLIARLQAIVALAGPDDVMGVQLVNARSMAIQFADSVKDHQAAEDVARLTQQIEGATEA